MAKEYVENQVALASLRNARIPARKARFIIDLIRGKQVSDALAILQHYHRPSAVPQIERLLKSAVSNVNKSDHPNPDLLRIGLAWVDGGPIMRRFRPRAMGRSAPIRKRMCHVTLVLTA